jgi:hypothetical protein
MDEEDREVMRERLRYLEAVQRTMRADLKPLLARDADFIRRFERAFERGAPLPLDDDGDEVLETMRPLSALNKEILSLMAKLPPEYR